MLRYLKEYGFYITLFFFLLIPIIALDTQNRNPRDYRLHDKVIVGITYPIQTAVHWAIEVVVDSYESYVYLWNVREINESLSEENRKLLASISSLRETQNENTRLRKLLNFQEMNKLQTVVARVVAKDVSTEFRALRLNRGEAAGIHKGMAVVTHEGIVGRVLRTTRSTSDVVTMLDPLSAVDSVIERSRARGVVEGLTEDICQLRFVLRTDDIQIGDILVSSGLGGVYPKSVPVGVVSKVKKKLFGISQDVEVRPSVDFNKLEEVLVVTEQRGEVIEREIATRESGAGVRK